MTVLIWASTITYLCFQQWQYGRKVAPKWLLKVPILLITMYRSLAVTCLQDVFNSCMLRPCIDGLICKLANYIFISCNTLYLSAQWSVFDDVSIKIIRIWFVRIILHQQKSWFFYYMQIYANYVTWPKYVIFSECGSYWSTKVPIFIPIAQIFYLTIFNIF